MKFANSGISIVLMLTLSCCGNEPTENASAPATVTSGEIKDTSSFLVDKIDSTKQITQEGTVSSIRPDDKEAKKTTEEAVTQKVEEQKKGTPHPGLLAAIRNSLDRDSVAHSPGGPGGSEGYVESETIYNYAQEMPQFPGGEVAMMEFIRRNIVFPESAHDREMFDATTYVEYVVEKDGQVSNVKPLKNPNSDVAKQLVRIVKTFPKHSPGKMDGKPVRVRLMVPLRIKLQ